MSVSRTLLITALLATPLIASCGLRGDLKTPPPIYGEDQRSEAEKAEAEEAEKKLRERKERTGDDN